MLNNWIKIAFRNYKNNWISTLINVLGLTLGITGLILMVANWDYENSYEDWNSERENVYLVENNVDGMGTMMMSNYPQASKSTERFDEIEDYTLFTYWGNEVLLKSGNKTVYAEHAFGTKKLFDLFPYTQVAGNLKEALVDEQSVVVSDRVAQVLFGEDYLNAIGETIYNDNTESSYILKGIYQLPKDSPTEYKPEVIFYTPDLEEEYNQNWANFGVITYFKLKPGTNVADLERKLSIQQRSEQRKNSLKHGLAIDEEEISKTAVYLTRLDKKKLYAKGTYAEKDLEKLKILTGLALLILILSAINFINLKTAEASKRAKEVGIRKAIGSSKSKIILQFLFETSIICILSFILSIGLAKFILPTFNKFQDVEIDLNNPQLLLYLFLGMIGIILISGLVPAIYLSNFKPINTLKGNFSRSAHGVWLRNGILTLQIIISSFFIIGSLIINTQMEYMLDKELGFNANQILHVSLHKDGMSEKYPLIKNTLQNLSAVEEVSNGAQNIGQWVTMSTRIENQDSTKNEQVALGAIDLNYMKFYDIKVLEGRDFNPSITADSTKNVLINQTLAKSFGWNGKEAIGDKIKVDNFDQKNKFYNVIGVVQDFHISGVDKEITPTIYFNFDRIGWTKSNFMGVDVKLKSKDIANSVGQIQRFFESEIEPGYPFDYHFVDKEFAKTFEKSEKQRTLFSILNFIVLLVALLGLFALSALMIEQKLKTVAIKKTLGASDKTLVFDLTKQFLIITTIAVLISIPISYYFMTEWLKDFAYRIDMPWWPYVLSLVVLLLLTFVVVSFKAYRATQVNLIQYLKYE